MSAIMTPCSGVAADRPARGPERRIGGPRPLAPLAHAIRLPPPQRSPATRRRRVEARDRRSMAPLRPTRPRPASTGSSRPSSVPMSSTHLASALVARFEHLRMTDVEAVGGKNASLGEMISQLSQSGVRVPGGFATTAHAFRQFLAEGGAGPADRRAPRPPRHRRRARPGRGRRRDPRLDRAAAVPAGARGGDPRRIRAPRGRQPRRDLRRALLGHRRGPAGRIVRRPAGDLPQRLRHRPGAGEDARGLRQPLQRPRHQLPGAQGLCAQRRRALGRGAADGAQRRRRRRRDVHDRHRERLHRRRLHHLELRPRRDRGPGRRQSRRVLRPQAGAAARQAGDHPPQPRLQADPHGLRLGRGAARARQAGDDPGHRHRAAQPLLAERRRRDRAGPLRRGDREALRPGDGHRVGQGRRRRQALHPPGAAGDGEEPGRRQGRAALRPQGHGHGARHRPGDRPEDRHRPGPAGRLGRRHGPGAGRRRARHRHDRPELGAGDEARRGDRHQPRRPHLPRGDHRPRARHPGGRRLRRRDRDAEGGRAGHRRLLRGRHRLRLRRPARDRGHRRAAGRAAVLAGEDDDEHRQSAARVRLRADAELRRRPGAARVHHQQQHRRAPEGDPRLSEHRRRPEEGGRERGPGPRLAARLLRRQARPRASPRSPPPSGRSR